MFCFNCGKEIHEGASFCPNCGNKVNYQDSDTNESILRFEAFNGFFPCQIEIFDDRIVFNQKKGITTIRFSEIKKVSVAFGATALTLKNGKMNLLRHKITMCRNKQLII